MLQLDGAATLERSDVPVRGKAQRIPKAHWLLDAELILEGSQRRCVVQRPITPRGPGKSVLKEHADDGHHGKAPICQLRSKLLFLLSRIARGEDLEAVVTWGTSLPVVRTSRQLNEAAVGNHLCPAKSWHLGDGSQAVGNVRELQASRVRQVARELTRDLGCDVAHGGKHGDAPVLQLDGAATLERSDVPVRGKAQRIPKAHWLLDAKLVLEGPQRRVGVKRP